MNTKVNKAYFLIPLVYAAVIIFLLYMQFSGSRSFSAEVSGITVSGKTHSGAPGRADTIPELIVITDGLNFSFGAENPLLVYTQDGLIHKTEPVDYRVTASGIDIKLSKAINVSFYHAQNDSAVLHISVTAEDPESIKFIHMPVTSSEAKLTAVEGSSVLSVSTETMGDFYLSIPEAGTYNSEMEAIVLYPPETGISELALEHTAGSGIDAFRYWVRGNTKQITEPELETLIKNYTSRSVKALTGSRYNQARGTWSAGSGGSAFSEEALVMAATETIGTPSYSQIKEQLDLSAAAHGRDIGILSSALFGNIVNEGWAYNQDLETKVTSLRKKALAGDFSVFEDKMLTAAVLTEDSESLIKALQSLASGTAGENISVKQAAAMLSFYDDINAEYPELGAQFQVLTSLVESVVLPSLKILADKLFIVNAEGRADILLSVKIGMHLADQSAIRGPEDYIRIGRALVSSVLELADESGLLPETAVEAGNGQLTAKGIITPETIYPLITASPYYPAADYFYSETGEKISVLNQADSFAMEKTDSGFRMTFKFPANQTHTFAVRNIKPFYKMQLLGYEWNPDHRFLNYSSGWWYDKQHNTLYVKIKHRTESEEIIIYTAAPPSPPQPVPAAEPAAETPPVAAPAE